MESNKPFLVKNILEMDDDSSEDRNKVIKTEEDSEKEPDGRIFVHRFYNMLSLH